LGAATGRHGAFMPLLVRDFALLRSVQGISSVVDGIFSVALALEALRIDN